MGLDIFFIESNSLWVRLIKWIYEEGGRMLDDSQLYSGGGMAKHFGSSNHLHESGFIPNSSMSRVFGNGTQHIFGRMCGVSDCHLRCGFTSCLLCPIHKMQWLVIFGHLVVGIFLVS